MSTKRVFDAFVDKKNTKKVSTKPFLTRFVDKFFYNAAAIFMILLRRAVRLEFYQLTTVILKFNPHFDLYAFFISQRLSLLLCRL